MGDRGAAPRRRTFERDGRRCQCGMLPRRQEHFPGYATSSKRGEKLPVAVDYVGVDLSWRSLLGKTQVGFKAGSSP